MGRPDEDNTSASLVPTSRFGIAKRSEAMVVRGLRDLEAKMEAPAEYELGVNFEFGASRNLTAAAVHYQKAAELGHIAAQCVMCHLLETGSGIEQDHLGAARWFGRVRAAAASWSQTPIEETNSGYAERLTDFCHRGHATIECGKEHWLKKAISFSNDRDRGDAFYHLGREFSGGLGRSFGDFEELLKLDSMDGIRVRVLPTQDLVRAYMWFQLSAEAYERTAECAIAAQSGDCSLGAASSRSMCRLAIARMSTSQIAEAERLATKWEMGLPQQAKRVLVVDDEEQIREIIVSMLNFHGFQCRSAESGVEALALLDSGERVDIVTSCLLMPEMDGVTLLDHMKRRYPSIPFAVVTAIHDVSVAKAVLRAGARDYLLKPFDRDQLLATIHRSLRKGHTGRAHR